MWKEARGVKGSGGGKSNGSVCSVGSLALRRGELSREALWRGEGLSEHTSLCLLPRGACLGVEPHPLGCSAEQTSARGAEPLGVTSPGCPLPLTPPSSGPSGQAEMLRGSGKHHAELILLGLQQEEQGGSREQDPAAHMISPGW